MIIQYGDQLQYYLPSVKRIKDFLNAEELEEFSGIDRKVGSGLNIVKMASAVQCHHLLSYSFDISSQLPEVSMMFKMGLVKIYNSIHFFIVIVLVMRGVMVGVCQHHGY